MSDESIADLERAVEEAWENINFVSVRKEQHIAFCNAMANWLAARRAARDAGMVPCMLSREAVEALRAAGGSSAVTPGNALLACVMLARDLADALKETPC